MTDIFKLLKKDHDKHRELLAKIAETHGDSDERRELFEEFKIEVSAHANAEEQALYGEMLQRPELQDKGRHSVAEHKEIDDYLKELEELSFSSPHWQPKFGEMRHRYEHHIEEEEQEIFIAADEEFSKACEEKLGKIFAERKPKELLKVESEA